VKYPWVVIGPNNYMSYCREKVAYLIEKTPNYRDAIDTFIHPRVVFDLPQNPSPDLVVDVMFTVQSWNRQAYNLVEFLKGEKEILEEIREQFGLNLTEQELREERFPVKKRRSLTN
jgi:hypothetical protein